MSSTKRLDSINISALSLDFRQLDYSEDVWSEHKYTGSHHKYQHSQKSNSSPISQTSPAIHEDSSDDDDGLSVLDITSFSFDLSVPFPPQLKLFSSSQTFKSISSCPFFNSTSSTIGRRYQRKSRDKIL